MKRIDGKILVFGDHEEGALAQIRAVATKAERAVLLADGHVGFHMPIGGVAAYEEKVSPVGVGFDIACIAAGERVVTRDGYHLPVEEVSASAALTCWDGELVRPISQHVGTVARGRKVVYRVALEGGRSLVATPDHRIRTPQGWVDLAELRPGQAVAVQCFQGLPYQASEFVLRPRVESKRMRQRLAEVGLDAVPFGDPRLPVLLRLLGYIAGDGHLSGDGKRVDVYTSRAEDVPALASDLSRLGFEVRITSRKRQPHYKTAYTLAVHSVALHACFRGLGCPVGKKEWSRVPFPWLLDLPRWAIAHFLSGFASAEGTCPRVHANGNVPNIVFTQSGNSIDALNFVADLLHQLDFDSSLFAHGQRKIPQHRQKFILQILGGESEQVRFLEEVGYVHCAEKRRAAARACAVAWRHQAHVGARVAAQAEARALHSAGRSWREVLAEVSARHGVAPGFVFHVIYSARGAPRRLPGKALDAGTSGEIVWAPVLKVEPAGVTEVYDIVTSDDAHCFFANGVVVHNCGNAAIRTDLTLAGLTGLSVAEVKANPHRLASDRVLNSLADEIATSISFGIGRKNRSDDAPTDDPLFHDPAWWAIPNTGGYRDDLIEKARRQLGTVGSGNHYVDVFADEEGRVWVGVHFGSRGLGHTIATNFLNLSQGLGWGLSRAKETEILLDLKAPLGHDYFALMNLAGRYAYAGREWVARKVVEILGGREEELVHNHHNYAWRESHDERELVVVRKGATPAFPGQKGFIGGSMGDDAVIVRGAVGAGEETERVQREALYSTVHGAGRVMSRTEAAGKRNRKTGKVLRPGRVTPEMMREWVGRKGVVLRGGGLDESPHVYRRLPDVIAAQGATVEILHTLRPLVVVMAGAREFDPYKD